MLHLFLLLLFIFGYSLYISSISNTTDNSGKYVLLVEFDAFMFDSFNFYQKTQQDLKLYVFRASNLKHFC